MLIPVEMYHSYKRSQFKARAPYEYTIDIGLCHDGADIVRIDAAAIENHDGRGDLRIIQIPDFAPNGKVRFLGLFRACGPAGSNCPDRLIGDDEALYITPAEFIQSFL